MNSQQRMRAFCHFIFTFLLDCHHHIQLRHLRETMDMYIMYCISCLLVYPLVFYPMWYAYPPLELTHTHTTIQSLPGVNKKLTSRV